VAEAPRDQEMTVLQHLEELRTRIIIASAAILIGMIVAAIWLTWPVMALLTEPARAQLGDNKLVAIKPGEMFLTYMKVALVTGAALAMPVIVYQLLKFVMPALHPHEQRYLYFAIPGITVSFAVGLAFGLLIVIPVAVRYLMGFGGDVVEAMWSVEEYLTFVSTLLFWIGVSFETPIVILFLARLGVVDHQQLARYRRYALVGAFVAAAIITPTPDPLNQAIVGIPMYLLYELGVLLARLVGRRPAIRPSVPQTEHLS
jgi:sec-independent protein translocase protein TatC